MKKLKEKIHNLFLILKKSIERFPLTIIAIIILTVIFSIAIDNDFISEEFIENLTLFMTIFASSTFLVETLINNKLKKGIIYYIISAFMALILTFLSNIKGDVLGSSNEIFLFRLTRFIVCYIITFIVLGIYFNYKKSKKSFEEYLTKTVISLFKALIVYGILAIGIAIVAAIFIYLILNGHHYTLIARIEVLLLGIYYIPTCIYAFYNQEEEIGKFAKIVIKYVLGTLVIVAFAIIYMYIIKIIALRNMPSNQIFRILSALFIIGLPIWTMISYWKDDDKFEKINNKLPLLFIPFIFLQMYSIGVRIKANGITEPRYLCLMLILFEIIYIAIYIKNKEKISNTLIVFIVLTIISGFAPYINMYNISNISQYNNLKIYNQKSEYTEEEKGKIYGAYSYLKNSVEGEKYIQNLKKEDIDNIKDLWLNTDEDKEYKNQKNIYVTSNTDYINVEGYKKLYNVRAYAYKDDVENKTLDEVFKNILFTVESTGDIFHANILPVVYKYMNESYEEQYKQPPKEIMINENNKLIFMTVSINYDKISQRVFDYRFDGYLLQK